MSQNELNPFGNTDKNTALIEVQQGRAMQEVQAAVIMAKQFPRDQRQAMNRILDSCTRKTLAEQSLYSYPKGGTQIVGPSIRLAEAIAQQWGNFEYGIIELEQSDGVSICQAYAWDLETNTRKVINFHVAHLRYSKNYGNKALTDPRDIYEMVSNQGSRRVRNCILAIIPGDVVEAAQDQCHVTQADNSPATPETIEALVKAFGGLNVSREMLNNRLGFNVDKIKSPQLIVLRRVYQSLKDQVGKISDFFQLPTAVNNDQPFGDTVNEEINPPKQKTKTNSKPAVKKETKADSAGGPSVEDIVTMISNAKTQDDVDLACDAMDGIDDTRRTKLLALAGERSRALAETK